MELNNKLSELKFSKQKGQIQLIIGPIFSADYRTNVFGTELMRRLKRYQLANHDCLIVKYANDNRYDEDCLSTHDREMMSAVSATKLGTLIDKALEKSVIGIDEGQFFPDIQWFAEEMALRRKTVIVAALDGTYQREGFANVLSLIPLAENVIKLNAVCMMCYDDASFTKRKGSETKLEVIGGADKYMAVCRLCFISPQKETRSKTYESHNENIVGRNLFS